MAQQTQNAAFAYDFEEPVRELDERIDELRRRAAEEARDFSDEIKDLEKERDEKLEEIFSNLSAYQRIMLARHPMRPQALDYAGLIFDDFMELHGDRRFGDDKAIVTGLARLSGRRIMLVAQQKGKEVSEKKERNFGMPEPEGYRKALHKMRLAEKFSIPVVCLIDTPGAAPSVGAEERGQGMAIAENIFTMSGLRTPLLAVVVGEGCSGGALGVGVVDRMGMMENAYFSVISPEGCAAILWKDRDKAPEAAQALRLTAPDMLDLGIADDIIDEPLGGAHRNPESAAEDLEEFLEQALDELNDIPIEKLLERRYKRYRDMGIYNS